MNKALVYCTNPDKLVMVNVEVSEETWDPCVKNGIVHDFIRKFEFENGFILLIYDQIFKGELNTEDIKNEISKALNQCEFYYVYHNDCEELKKFLSGQKGSSLNKGFEDHHELAGDFRSKYYIRLKDVVESSSLSNEMFESLWSDFVKKSNLEDDIEYLYKFYQEELGKGNQCNIEAIKIERDKLLDRHLL